MSFLIAITGKGGVGKTSVAGLLVARLIRRGCRPVLAVDADPNSCLDGVLGVQVAKTVGGVREEARQMAGQGMAAGVSKQEMLELKIAESLVEANDFDLIAMGRPEGPGCYCYANNVLKSTLAAIADEYPYVVLDNEAGLENLSRRLVQKVDLMVMVADPSRRGLETLARLHRLAVEMEIGFDKLALVVNRLRHDELPAIAATLQSTTGAKLLVGLPEDRQLAEFGEAGHNLFELPDDNPVVRQIDALLDSLNLPAPRH